MYITNAFTKFKTSHVIGSKDELSYFRVMPLGCEANKYECTKLFFDSQEQYEEYSLGGHSHLGIVRECTHESRSVRG